MAEELRSIDVSDAPEVLRLAQEVAETGVGRVLRTAERELALLMPVPRSRKRARRKDGLVTRDDSLFRLIGIGASGIEGGTSERKHEFLAKAYRPRE
jgi:hypothetical protein